MLDLILNHVVRSILIILFGTAINTAIIIIDARTHGAITGLSIIGIMASCALCGVLFVNQHKIDRWRWLAVRKLRRDHKRVDPLERFNQRGEAEPDGLNTLFFVVALVAIFVSLVLAFTKAEGAELDTALLELTKQHEGAVLLTGTEFAALRELSTRVALLQRAMQSPPPSMPADLQNKRSRARVALDNIQDSLMGIITDHAGTVLRRQGGAR